MLHMQHEKLVLRRNFVLLVFTILFDTYERKFALDRLIIQKNYKRKNRVKNKYPVVTLGEVENFNFKEK